MRYVVTGGGTGGHVTPIRHVVASLKEIDTRAEIAYIGQKNDRISNLITDQDVDSKIEIRAGKFRRYQRPLWQTIIDIPTHLLNIRDAFYVLIGCAQAWLFIRKFKPDAIFVKGGYVSVPVGLVGAWKNIPIVTHDSDLTPGLANQIVGKWAKYNAVASSAGEYPYTQDKMRVVGVPVSRDYFQNVDEKRQAKAKNAIGAGENNPVVLVIGGSLGAKAINDGMILNMRNLMEIGAEVFHITGRNNFAETNKKLQELNIDGLYHLIDFIDEPDLLLEHYVAADLVVSRAGATNTAEIAGLKKPAVIIPSQVLSDQQANAKELENMHAAIILQDKDIAESPERLFEAIELALKDEELSHGLSENIAKMANSGAADDIAALLYEVAQDV